jgi:hypothetical protein
MDRGRFLDRQTGVQSLSILNAGNTVLTVGGVSMKELKTKMILDQRQLAERPLINEEAKDRLTAVNLVPGNLQHNGNLELTIEDVKKELQTDFPIHYLLYKKDFVRLV